MTNENAITFSVADAVAMWKRIVTDIQPAASSPYRAAYILGDDGNTKWRVNQGWKLNPNGRREIAWDRAQVGFPSGIVEPEEVREMALALLVLAELAEAWNQDNGKAIPEQMARVRALPESEAK